MSEPAQTNLPESKPQLSNGGCFVNFLFLIGVMIVVYGIVGYIAGLFGYELKMKGAKMGLVDLPVFLGLLGAAVIFIGLGFLFRFIGKMISKRKANQQK